jgi:thiamine pyrophosphokinase
MAKNNVKLAERRQELADVNKAIRMILAGAQSYTIGSRSLTRANLMELRNWKKELEDEITALSGGGGRFRRVVPVG